MKPDPSLVAIGGKPVPANGTPEQHASHIARKKTHAVKVGHVMVGGGAPVVVQSMTNTDTADANSTFQQCLELAQAGSELVRITVNVPEAAAAVPEIKQRLLD